MKTSVKENQSPMLKKHAELKQKHPDAVILYRCGDFYETYEEDAEVAAQILGITLTKRNSDGLKMAGFPYHALETYLPKMIRFGKRVAICNEEDYASPTEIVTPGTPEPQPEKKQLTQEQTNELVEQKLISVIKYTLTSGITIPKKLDDYYRECFSNPLVYIRLKVDAGVSLSTEEIRFLLNKAEKADGLK